MESWSDSKSKGARNSRCPHRIFGVKNIQAENQNRVPRSEELKNFKGKRVLRTKKITTHAFESGVLVEVLWYWPEQALKASIGQNFRNAFRRRLVLITLCVFGKVALRVGSRLPRKFFLDCDAIILRSNCLTCCRTSSESVCVLQQSSERACEHFARKIVPEDHDRATKPLQWRLCAEMCVLLKFKLFAGFHNVKK